MRQLNSINKIFLLLCLVIAGANVTAQNRNQLENKKKQIQKEIEFTESLLNETKKNQQLTLDQLQTLNKKISLREDLIQTMRVEVKLIDTQINETNNAISELSAELKKLKDEYAQMIYYANKNQNIIQRMMFIFSAEDFNQAYKRFKYLQQYSIYRKKQAEQITETQKALDVMITQLNNTKRSKLKVLGEEQNEKEILAKEKQEEEGALTSLQKKEKELLKQKKQKEDEQRKLELAIKRIIEEEIRKANEAAKKAGKKESTSLTLTAEAQQLSSSFENNKNKLPWPVLRGIIVSKFGKHPHPVLVNITVNNNGIDISTEKGSKARAIFEGEVTGLAVIPGFGNVVMVRHGEYLSVYSNLAEVFVKKGEKLLTKQDIGKVDTDENGKTQLHLEIWKGSNVQDPELWLSK